MRVALFVACFNDALFPATGIAVVRLLERLGHQVTFPPEQTCCGQMHWTTGYHREAAGLADRFAEVFAGQDVVVTPAASCAATVRHAHPTLISRTSQTSRTSPISRTSRPSGTSGGSLTAPVARSSPASRAAAGPPPVYELSEFLVDVLGVTDVGAYFPHRVAYHPTCHAARVLRSGDRPLRLLRAVRGLELAELPEAGECCGFGGTFAMKNADVSVAMVADKVRHIRESAADVVCAADNGCLAHIGGALTRLRSGVRVMHLAEILAATGADPAESAP